MLDWTLPALTTDDLIVSAVIAALILLPIIGIFRLILWPRTLYPAAPDGGGAELGDAERHERSRRNSGDDKPADSSSDRGGDGGGGSD
jgi:hypothetical protein